MIISFQGKFDEYQIQKSLFCADALIIKDSYKNRDGVNFINSNAKFLEFTDQKINFKDLLESLQINNEDNVIIIQSLEDLIK